MSKHCLKSGNSTENRTGCLVAGLVALVFSTPLGIALWFFTLCPKVESGAVSSLASQWAHVIFTVLAALGVTVVVLALIFEW